MSNCSVSADGGDAVGDAAMFSEEPKMPESWRHKTEASIIDETIRNNLL